MHRLIKFYDFQPSECSNRETIETRTLWNMVIYALDSCEVFYLYIIYERKTNNELRSGLFNMVQVLQKILNLELSPLPKFSDLLIFQKVRIMIAFEEIFISLNPKAEVDIEFSDLVPCLWMGQQ